MRRIYFCYIFYTPSDVEQNTSKAEQGHTRVPNKYSPYIPTGVKAFDILELKNIARLKKR